MGATPPMIRWYKGKDGQNEVRNTSYLQTLFRGLLLEGSKYSTTIDAVSLMEWVSMTFTNRTTKWFSFLCSSALSNAVVVTSMRPPQQQKMNTALCAISRHLLVHCLTQSDTRLPSVDLTWSVQRINCRAFYYSLFYY